MQKQKQLLRQIISGEFKKQKSRYIQTSPQKIDHDNQQHHHSLLEDYTEQQQQEIRQRMKNKIATFSKWDLRKSLPISPQRARSMRREQSNQEVGISNNSHSFKINLSGLVNKNIKGNNNQEGQSSGRNQQQQLKKIMNNRPKPLKLQKIHPKQQNSIKTTRNLSPQPPTIHPDNKKQVYHSAQQEGVHSDRRERFKKLENPMVFIKFYMQNQNYQPEPQQKQLLQKLLGIQKLLLQNPLRFQVLLQKLYGLMNLAVDYNELIFLTLLILLAADTCLYMKDLSKAFYFYNQTRIAGGYAHLDKLKISGLIGMGKIAFQMKQYQSSSRVFKKALQYTWRTQDQDTELEIYDWLGQTLHAEGKVKDSNYYHTRYINGQIQKKTSTLIKISDDILREYDRHINSLQDSNLNSLFIEYLNLPIGKDITIKKSVTDKQFINYTDGESPRMKKKNRIFNQQHFLDAKIQLQKLLEEDFEFISEIENPDSQKNNSVVSRLGKAKHEIDFQHSFQYNKIMGVKRQTFHQEKLLKLPLEVQVRKMLEDRLDPKWWEKMVEEAKKKRYQKVGALKDRVRNSHLSYHKYPSQRRRNQKWSVDQINQSFNRTLLDWIDPPANLSPKK